MEVMSWGANSHGQLGIGILSEKCDTPQAVAQTWSGTVKTIAGGGGHSLLIDEQFRIYACGWNLQRQLGLDDKNCYTFTRIWDLSGINFIKACTGWDASAAISDNNVLYLWGSNAYGQLGLPREHFPGPIKPIQLELKARDICMGLRHTVLLDINGHVWTTGCGKKGQLGHKEDVTSLDTFNKIQNLNNIDKVVCGQHHTVAWCKAENAIYAWGDNTHGQLGLNTNTYNQVFVPTKISLPLNSSDVILDVIVGWTHSAVLLKNDAIYWGRNNYGQLACDEHPKDSFNRVIIKDNNIRLISIGSEHTICLTDNDTLWAWGWNEHANTGTGLNEIVREPLHVKTSCKNIINIISGAGHNFLIAKK